MSHASQPHRCRRLSKYVFIENPKCDNSTGLCMTASVPDAAASGAMLCSWRSPLTSLHLKAIHTRHPIDSDWRNLAGSWHRLRRNIGEWSLSLLLVFKGSGCEYAKCTVTRPVHKLHFGITLFAPHGTASPLGRVVACGAIPFHLRQPTQPYSKSHFPNSNSRCTAGSAHCPPDDQCTLVDSRAAELKQVSRRSVGLGPPIEQISTRNVQPGEPDRIAATARQRAVPQNHNRCSASAAANHISAYSGPRSSVHCRQRRREETHTTPHNCTACHNPVVEFGMDISHAPLPAG